MGKNKFNYEWTLKDIDFPKNKGKVFSCFSCSGGSTMGYKLAGFDVVGCCEIDKKAIEVYNKNHNPEFSFNCSIRELLHMELPTELYHLDILDGSPPCTPFSTAGLREKTWGVEKKFREGQTKQVLDTLFFDFISLAKHLRPKVAIAENVVGLTMGKAKKYMEDIYSSFDDAGYHCTHYILDSSTMGVPQKRKRVFFICVRKDLGVIPNNFDMTFTGETINYGKFVSGEGEHIKGKILTLWENKIFGDANLSYAHKRMFKKASYFSQALVYMEGICPTLTAHKDCVVRYDVPQFLSIDDWKKISSFPMDFDFMGRNPYYFMGMSVPPVMMANVAERVYNQILLKINSIEMSAFRELLLSL